jgi:CRP-like cAMP-binding protein
MDPRETQALAALGLTDDEARALLAATEVVKLAPGDVLIERGKPGERLYVVVSGELGVWLDGDKRINTIGPAGWTGEIAVLDPGPAAATVKATEPTVLRALTAEKLRWLRDHEPRIASKILHELSKELAARLRGQTRSLLTALGAPETAPEEPSLIQSLLSRLFGGSA